MTDRDTRIVTRESESLVDFVKLVFGATGCRLDHLFFWLFPENHER